MSLLLLLTFREFKTSQPLSFRIVLLRRPPWQEEDFHRHGTGVEQSFRRLERFFREYQRQDEEQQQQQQPNSTNAVARFGKALDRKKYEYHKNADSNF